jgi:hypothetical protein
MAHIVYNSIPQLARQLEADLTEDDFRQLIRVLVRNNIAEFQEYRRDNIAQGNYAPVVKTCVACGRPM